jgi:hypothetical protein
VEFFYLRLIQQKTEENHNRSKIFQNLSVETGTIASRALIMVDRPPLLRELQRQVNGDSENQTATSYEFGTALTAIEMHHGGSCVMSSVIVWGVENLWVCPFCLLLASLLGLDPST